MRADVTQDRRHPASLRVDPPLGLFLSFGLEQGGEPSLGILDHHLSDLTERPCPHPLPGLLYHRIPGVVVGDREDEIALRS